jgi:hypothetical protein
MQVRNHLDRKAREMEQFEELWTYPYADSEAFENLSAMAPAVHTLPLL